MTISACSTSCPGELQRLLRGCQRGWELWSKSTGHRWTRANASAGCTRLIRSNANGRLDLRWLWYAQVSFGRYVRITAQQIGLILDEVIFRLEDQTVLPAQVVSRVHANETSTLFSDPENLLDEQDTLEGEPSWYNSTYFDEIYHAHFVP